MKEESETPFTFNPSENNDLEQKPSISKFCKNNKKQILIIIGGIIAIIIIVIILILIFSKGKNDKNKNSSPDIKPNPDERAIPDDKISNNYLITKYEVPED